jgi:hypothetical protein
LRNGSPVCVQIKHRANTLGDEKQRSRVGELHSRGQRMIRFVERNLKIAVSVIYRNRTAIAAILDRFYTRRGASCKEGQHTLPVIRRPKAEAE